VSLDSPFGFLRFDDRFGPAVGSRAAASCSGDACNHAHAHNYDRSLTESREPRSGLVYRVILLVDAGKSTTATRGSRHGLRDRGSYRTEPKARLVLRQPYR
jgi:hypothetical protein